MPAFQPPPSFPPKPIHDLLPPPPDPIHPQPPTVVDTATDRTLTFRDLHAPIDRVALNLQHRLGVAKGDVVLVFTPNSLDFAISFLSIVAIGAVTTTVNLFYTIVELVKQVKDSGARLVFTISEL